MQIQFNCFCSTQWGQDLYVTGSSEELGNWDVDKAVPLSCKNFDRWEKTVLFKASVKEISYKYFMRDQSSGIIHWENKNNRRYNHHNATFTTVKIIDYWCYFGNEQDTLESAAFSKVLFKRTADDKSIYSLPKTEKTVIEFCISAPVVPQNAYLALSGSSSTLGQWDIEKALPLDGTDFPIWKVIIPLKSDEQYFDYKFVIINKETKTTFWEPGENRKFFLSEFADGLYCKITEPPFKHPNAEIKGAGVSIPVFSLRTKNSFGVGDFTDLKSLVDWSVKTNLSLIQLLPINDTIATNTFLDSYPYKAISVFALHPIFVNLFKMGKLADAQIMNEYTRLQAELNKNNAVDYTQITQLKLKYAKLLFKEQHGTFLKNKSFNAFFKANENWLVPYAAFSYLRDQNNTPDYKQWGKFAQYINKDIDALTNPDSDTYLDIAFWYFIQYHLDKQLKEATEYGRNNGIVFKGDIPIGISRNSVDAWYQPNLYHFEGQAGAPPDDFSIDGQNWGFPTYNWEEMKKNNYQWWQKRLTKMAEYFDAYRIDHILGFFRIWEIPSHAVQGILGYFRPALPFSTEELQRNGIWFDYDRYCKPYIREHFLYDVFGHLTEHAIENYLIKKDFGVFELKTNVDTQQKIQKHFVGDDGPEALTGDDKILYYGLITLAANVILIPANEKENHYHPRISLHSTRSYQDLDEHHKSIFNNLYIHYFYHRHEAFWKEEALNKLPHIAEATDMLICGEDLGMIPASVPDVMRKFNMLSLEIQRMPKNPKIKFAHPSDAPYLSVCTTSTHDMSTIRGWWEENREQSQLFFNNELGEWGDAPIFAEPWICEKIINQHIHSPAMWTILPIQDYLAMDAELRNEDTHGEQINVPANPRHYWKYRLHLSLETLNKAKSFNNKLAQLIEQAGRKI